MTTSTERKEIELQEGGIEGHIEKLKDNIYATKGSRFNAARRLNRMVTYSGMVLFLISFLVACFSLLSLVFADVITAMQIKIIGVATVILSFFGAFVSVMEGRSRNSISAYILHRCGLELTELFHDIVMHEKLDKFDASDFVDFNERYDAIMGQNQENHSQMDYRYFMVCNQARFNKSLSNVGPLLRFWIRFRYACHPLLISIFYLAIPVAVASIASFAFLQAGVQQ